ncbi:secretin N-terminal domain-containing protein [Rubripirellula tenax]|uniref:secretin N-terminal domain-containing protein n=1 Tax=Rubripirellula tenax TaxID=2528015 RepID=UPI0011B366E1|nr:secretin N-terminal domain-containing protein [Rubripirellula tenax]
MSEYFLPRHRIVPFAIDRLSPRLVITVLVAIVMFGSLVTPSRVAAQPTPSGDDIVELNLAGSVSLTKLVEAVSKQMNVRFLYSADLANRQVTVYTPAKLPKSALPALIGSLLKGENLAIVDSDVPGWKRIVDIADMVPYAKTGQAGEVLRRDGPAAAVTQVIPVKHLNLTQLSQAFKGFLSKSAGFITLADNGLIVVTDYAQNVQSLVDLLAVLDRPSGQPMIDFYLVRNRNPASLIEQVQSLLGGGEAKTSTDKSEYKLFNDSSGNRIVVAGEKEKVAEIIRLLKQLDSGTDFQTRAYRLQNISAERIDKLIRGLVSSDEAETSIETTIDEEGNLLIVRAGAEVHGQVETLLKELDKPVSNSNSPIQFYKLKNANAVEVLYSLLALQQAAGVDGVAGFGGGLGGGFGSLGGLNVGGVVPAAGLGLGMALGAAAAQPGGFGDTGGQNIRLPFNNGNGVNNANNLGGMQNQNQALNPLIGNAGFGGVANGGGLNAGLGGLGAAGGLGGSQVATLPGGARVSADVATNSLIVFAPSNVQALYEKLIKSLDQRRPQVMIEADIIAVDTTDNFSLGVEVSLGDRTGSKRLFKFTSFGLSEVDATSGALSVIPNLGFNGVLIDPDVADVIVQALSRHTRSRVLASPKILVNDNQTGTLESVASVPFLSINTINTISSQSLGGDQQAGTSITVTPHINEDDHLQLEFEVEFSTFTGSGGANLPPPRQIDRVGSVVTIPDGKTVVVGGLKRVGDSSTFTGVPWAEKIPLLRELTSMTTSDQSTTSFFLFIRPKILRDSKFRDLKYLSDIEAQDAQIPGDDPESGPILIPCLNPPTSMTTRSIREVPHHESVLQH